MKKHIRGKMWRDMKTVLVASALLCFSSELFAQTNVTTKTIIRTYSGDDVSIETNITHTLTGHESLREMGRRTFADIDASLSLRESRKGYKGGEWAKSWETDAVAWLEKQDLTKLPKTFEYVDSKGFRHLMALAIENCGQRASRARMARKVAEMKAKAAISKAWDAEIERVSTESRFETANGREEIKKESSISVGSHQGIVRILSKEMQISGQRHYVEVYGILPEYMVFK